MKPKHGGARERAFTEEQVKRMRERFADGTSVADIAKDYGRYDTVSRVVLGKSYRHLLGDVGTSRKTPKAKNRVAKPVPTAEAVEENIETAATAAGADVALFVEKNPTSEQIETIKKAWADQYATTIVEGTSTSTEKPVGFLRGRAVQAGDTIKDCDPRKDRHGVVLAVTSAFAAVKWDTGKETNVKLAAIHNRVDGRKGYLLTTPTSKAVVTECCATPAAEKAAAEADAAAVSQAAAA